MNFAAKIIKDSISPSGVRLTTLAITYPRFIHVEMLRHRMWSRNCESSRAIPVKRRVERCMEDPVEPIEWGRNKPGMQATEVLSKEDEARAREHWHAARMHAITAARLLDSLNVHKQVSNRVFETWVTMTEVVTATEFRNFEFLRINEAADPNIQKIATLIRDARDKSTPTSLAPGEWHLPFIEPEDREKVQAAVVDDPIATLKRMSAARCARTSLLNHEGKRPAIEDDLKLFDRLVSRQDPMRDPGHWSPLEHQATPLADVLKFGRAGYRTVTCDFCHWMLGHGEHYSVVKFRVVEDARTVELHKSLCDKCGRGHAWSGNFRGWQQFRKEFPNENFDAV